MNQWIQVNQLSDPETVLDYSLLTALYWIKITVHIFITTIHQWIEPLLDPCKCHFSCQQSWNKNHDYSKFLTTVYSSSQ